MVRPALEVVHHGCVDEERHRGEEQEHVEELSALLDRFQARAHAAARARDGVEQARDEEDAQLRELEYLDARDLQHVWLL